MRTRFTKDEIVSLEGKQQNSVPNPLQYFWKLLFIYADKYIYFFFLEKFYSDQNEVRRKKKKTTIFLYYSICHFTCLFWYVLSWCGLIWFGPKPKQNNLSRIIPFSCKMLSCHHFLFKKKKFFFLLNRNQPLATTQTLNTKSQNEEGK